MRLCQLLDSNNINVVCAILSISEKDRKWCRKNFSKYFEIYIKSNIISFKKGFEKFMMTLIKVN